MDPTKDFEKANKIIEYHKNKLGLKGEYKLKIEPRLNGCAAPDSLCLYLHENLRFRPTVSIKFDRRYFKELNEREFTSALLHELGHVKANQIFWAIIKIIVSWFLPAVLLLVYFQSPPKNFLEWLTVCGWVFYLVILIRTIHRNNELEADKIAGINRGDSYGLDDLISAIDKADCNNNSRKMELIKKFFPHPSKEERKARLGDCSTNSTSESGENAKFLENGKEDVKKIILSLREQYGEYHRHKENMAWLGTVLYLGFIFGLINFVTRYDLKIFAQRPLSVIILFAVGISYFYYVREQLKLRRQAVIIVDACLSLNFKLLKDSFKIPESELEFCNGIIISEGKKFPKILQDEIDERAKEGKHPSLERLELSILGIIILATLLALILTWTPRSDYILLTNSTSI